MTVNPRVSNSTRYKRAVSKCRERGGPCAICWHDIDYSLQSPDPMSFEVDHIVPVSKGGDLFDPMNLQPSHRCCNNWRKSRPMSYIDDVMSGKVVPRTPPPIWRDGAKRPGDAAHVVPTFEW